MKNLPVLRAFIVTVLLLLAFAVQAEDNRGRVMYIRGSVTALDETTGVPRILRADSHVRLGEIIETGPKSVVQIVFPDRSMLHVKSETKVKVETYNFTPAKPEDDGMVVNLLKGGMRSLTGLVGKRNPGQVRYKTPVATIGIRGTILEISQTPDGGFETIFDYGGGFMQSKDRSKLLLNAREAARVGTQGSNPEKVPYKRPENDPAALAGKLATAPVTEVLNTTGIICKELDAGQVLLMVAMGQSVPGATAESTGSTVQGLTTCLPIEISATMLSTAAYIDPENASLVLDAAISGGANVAIALESVLRGMEHAPPETIQSVVETAVEDHGLSTSDANNIRENLASEGICR
ncbi:MAG: FecR domain-containing protein [Gammaproteobacteria bacterium]|jgi:hypothetical protein